MNEASSRSHLELSPHTVQPLCEARLRFRLLGNSTLAPSLRPEDILLFVSHLARVPNVGIEVSVTMGGARSSACSDVLRQW